MEVDLTDEGKAFSGRAHDEAEREVAGKLASLSAEGRARLLEASRVAVEVLGKL